MNKRIVFFFIIFFLFIAYAYFILNGKKELLIKYIVTNQLYDRSLEVELNNILGKIIVNTPFDQKFIVNGPQRKGFLHIYILPDNIENSDSKEINNMLASLKSNCAYLGIKNTIVCSGKFLRNGFTEREGIKELLLNQPNPRDALRKHRATFITWVLGHEMGHILKGHKAAPFSEKSFYGEVLSTSLTQKQEMEADKFAYERIYSNPEISMELESLMIDLINSEIRTKIGRENIPAGVGILYDYTGKHIIEYASQGTHPEFIIRATRLLLFAGEREGKEWLKAMASKLASHMSPKRIE